MDGNTLMTLIGSVGFPIVACLAMAYYVKYITDKNRDQIDAIIQQHRQEMSDVITAVNNNTLALQKLSDFMERGENVNE